MGALKRFGTTRFRNLANFGKPSKKIPWLIFGLANWGKKGGLGQAWEKGRETQKGKAKIILLKKGRKGEGGHKRLGKEGLLRKGLISWRRTSFNLDKTREAGRP